MQEQSCFSFVSSDVEASKKPFESREPLFPSWPSIRILVYVDRTVENLGAKPFFKVRYTKIVRYIFTCVSATLLMLCCFDLLRLVHFFVPCLICVVGVLIAYPRRQM